MGIYGEFEILYLRLPQADERLFQLCCAARLPQADDRLFQLCGDALLPHIAFKLLQFFCSRFPQSVFNLIIFNKIHHS